MPPKRRLTGTVGVVGMDTGRFSEFSMSLGRLELPKDWELYGAFNYDCAHACNFLADSFVGDALMLMGDDHQFGANLLTGLLEHDVPIVAPLCLSRRPPFAPVARIDHKPIELEGAPRLIEVDVTGTAGMVIRREVFEALEPPYFQNEYVDGQLVTDDIFFCRKAREAGFDIHVDTSLALTHTALVQITPAYDGEWHRMLEISGLNIEITDASTT